MLFCPNCSFEYKPQITICPDCGATLVSRLEKEKVEKIKYVPLRKIATRLYAQMLKEALEKQNIPCIINSENAEFLGFPYNLPLVVWVPEELKQEAEEIAFQILGEA